ncbi:hypothetical protein [Bacillus sp. OTU530]|uniref:hypothetical protein n=1 Tax=Bacillus sp. OTU530 TaxID=3043862 RepID=UPI00313B50B9
MSFDIIGMQQIQQAETATGKRLVLKRQFSRLDIGLAVAAILLFLPTLTISFWLFFIYLAIKEGVAKTYLVKNVVTGEKFRVTKQEFKQYKKQQKNKEKEVKSITNQPVIETVTNITTKSEVTKNPITNVREDVKEEIITQESAPVSKEESQVNSEALVQKRKAPVLVSETSYSRTYEEENAYVEYIDFYIAGTAFRQKEIKKAIKLEQEGGISFDEQYQGMTNKEILEETFDQRIFQYDNTDTFSECSLQPEPENEHDPQAIAVYIYGLHVGYVPQQNFKRGKAYILNKISNEENLYLDVSLKGGKYKINVYDEKIETGETDYKLEGHIVIRTNK